MAISGVNPKCYILALFVRDDGARFLLGDDPFEFKDNQLHFQQNTMANDVVEVQGNDGYLLAGQVRRPGTQMFDGYVCNGTNSKEEVEVKRRAFLQFFRRSHFYKVIYVFPNGTAIQRKQGFLVDDPTVQELYQQYPEYHVALNFEDVNYYTYEEDDQGHEIYAKEAIVPLARGGATGGLIWDNYGVVWEDPWSLPLSISGVQFQILNNAGVRAPIENVELYGDTYQQTYSGKNLLVGNYGTSTQQGIDHSWNNVYVTLSGTTSSTYSNLTSSIDTAISAGTYTFSTDKPSSQFRKYIRVRYGGANHDYYIDTGATSVTFTIPDNATDILIRILHIGVFNPGMQIDETFGLMLETGSSASPFEPYTGGIPAPNPDYPETVNVVTGVQNVWAHGKNLLPFTNQNVTIGTLNAYSQNGSLYLNGAASASIGSNSTAWKNNFKITLPAGTYALSGDTSRARTIRKESDGSVVLSVGIGISSGTFTLAEETEVYFGLYISSGASFSNYKFDAQLERSSTATAYEPYQGATYTIDLGATELCKIGTYQDYIYKSGDDWYVHKEISKQVFDGSGDEDWAVNGSGTASFYYRAIIPQYSATNPAYSNYFSRTNISSSNTNVGFVLVNSTAARFRPNFAEVSLTDWKTWLSSHNTLLYYIVGSTDTKITDATLVGQLEALDAMKLFIGENNVLVSTPTPNLPATLALDYYTKFASIGAEWEEGGTKGATIVNVDAIDNTYPVWELTGPATNPTLSVLTTNTALTYNGTITASQKLVIDMFNKTATLNGTSVIGNISGDFVYMAPGTNRLAYTAGNTDAPDSTIYWQEVVG